MNVYFIRHGRTNFNDLGLCNDDPNDDVHLTSAGEQQARQAAQRMATVPIRRIYVSQLPRTRQTAEILNEAWGVEIVTHLALNDIRSGFNRRPVREYQAAIAHDRLHARCNGGESLLDHKRRVLGFLGELRRNAEGPVLVVAHEESLRVFYAEANRVPDEQMIDLSFANCEFFEVNL